MDDDSSRFHEAEAHLHQAFARQTSGQAQAAEGSAPQWHSERGGLSDVARVEEISKLKEPGGFRRHYLNAQAEEAGIPQSQRPAAWRSSLMDRLRPLARSGYFDSILGIRLDPNTGEEIEQAAGTTSDLGTYVALLKCYIGTCITFIPGAFAKGGWLFSSLTLLTLGVVNFFTTWMLLEIRTRTGLCGLGDMGQKSLGHIGKRIVQVSLVISQYGTCIAYMIFICELGSDAVHIHKNYILIVQLLVLIPLCLIRTVDKLEFPNLLADVLILGGLFIMCLAFACHMKTSGPAPDFKAYNSKTWGLFIGTAIFSFEGTPLLMPIANSMAQPQHFWRIFAQVFAFVVVLFTVFGLIGYRCYGSEVESVVLLNLPKNGIAGSTKLIFMIALSLSWPLVFLPGIRIVELWMFGIRKKENDKLWMELARIVQVLALGLIALLCANGFQKFIAVAGALCSGPIMMIYPPLFHLLLCAERLGQQVIDLFFLVFGVVAIILCMTHLDM
eukprot:gnl/TRDRNA2_/TRDRNA2_177053_c3_seq1.p2 gnl/TRDRNA2_/TRDRNA2_177053_c3~~gnl/TRDRNA2_/TRDRNA2_177053_c3_seq1.p2  ORF type:complete len:499 (+),score=89.90 gnl/TRDRNA2_/TRDRNA2_177053_c3_seq1:86-1582(+)